MAADTAFFETLKRSIEKDDYSFSIAKDTLAEFKANAGKKEDAILYLTYLKTAYRENEVLEDRVLELLDIATGFCRSDLRIWD